MTDHTTTPPMLLSPSDLARELGVSVRTVFRMAASRKLPAEVRVGRRRRWLSRTIRAWCEAGCPPRDEWERQGGAR